MPVNPTPVIAIIGGGFSGSMVAAQLLRQAGGPLTIKLVERSPRLLHRGIAYSTDASYHLLNVPAGNMSALPDDPDHLIEWANTNPEKLIEPPWVNEITGSSFISRRAYGEYIRSVVNESAKASRPDVRLEVIADEVVHLSQCANHASLTLKNGNQIYADKVVLAVGNFPPSDPVTSIESNTDNNSFISSPWAEDAESAWNEAESGLIIGTGLTMVDWVLRLHAHKFPGKIHVISRRGLLPKEHTTYPALPYWLNDDEQPLTVRLILRKFRNLMTSGGAYKNNWRGLIDALRPHTARVWRKLPLVEQRRFLRHLRPYWDNHRHRVAPLVAAIFKDIESRGQIQYHTGRIEKLALNPAKIEVTIRARGSDKRSTLLVDRVMNCTGTECDYRKLQHPLMQHLLKEGLAQTDPISFGIAVAGNGALIDISGCISSIIYTLGPPQKGTFWETTAVPEIRVQADNLARELLAKVGQERKTILTT